MTSISRVFSNAKREHRGVFVTFSTLGDPTLGDSVHVAQKLAESGADILELGIPFSDPVADGPTIQESYGRAFAAGITTEKALYLISQISRMVEQPLVVLTYYNIILQRGIEKFCADVLSAGVSGVVVPDLPIEEAEPLLSVSGKNGIDIIFLVTPMTTKSRLEKISSVASGFLYLVSLLGVTGARHNLPSMTRVTVKRISEFTKGKIPVAVGFGISRPSHVKEVLSAGADGVIVGSAIIDILGRHHELQTTLNAVGKYVSEMKAATSLH